MERNTLDGARREQSVSAGKRPLLTRKLQSQQPHPLQHVDSKEGANLLEDSVTSTHQPIWSILDSSATGDLDANASENKLHLLQL